MSFESVMERVGKACERSGRTTDELTVVAVSKGRSVEEIAALFDRGHRDFGENRAQELASKAPELPGAVRWHFVGPLQTNKVKLVRPVVDVLHSLDRVKLARAWGTDSPPAYLEFNLGRERQKHGFDPDDAHKAAAACIEAGVDVQGVMAIPPVGEDARPYFNALRDLRDQLRTSFEGIVEVSAGMSDDFEGAIEAGSTTIRVGRAIFEDGG